MPRAQARETVRGKASATREALLTGPVFPQVVRFGIPTMISMLTPAIYNTTAAYFVSDLGTTAIAALGIVFALHMIMASIGIMAGQGCASQTSRLLGAGEDEVCGLYCGYRDRCFAFGWCTAHGLRATVCGTLVECLGRYAHDHA